MKVLFVQPFPLNGSGGGARIMRFLIQNCPFEAVVLNTAIHSAQPSPHIREFQLKERPRIPLIENIARFQGFYKRIARAGISRWEKRFLKLVTEIKPDCIHSVYGDDQLFACVQNVANSLSIPHVLSVHDDNASLEYRDNAVLAQKTEETWLESSYRYVISEEMGEEYCRRYGKKDFAVITDGIENVLNAETRVTKQTRGRVYFTGLLHISYEPNISDLMTCLESIKEDSPEALLVSRGGYPRPTLVKNRNLFEYRDFQFDLDYIDDTKGFDFLLLPLPFGEQYKPFIQFSFSTKLITYLNLGIPILYYGPDDAAIYKMLKRYDAAITITDQNKEMLRQALSTPYNRRAEVVKNAYKLATDHFRKEVILERFYNPITSITKCSG